MWKTLKELVGGKKQSLNFDNIKELSKPMEKEINTSNL